MAVWVKSDEQRSDLLLVRVKHQACARKGGREDFGLENEMLTAGRALMPRDLGGLALGVGTGGRLCRQEPSVLL
jgi:hypothetical protein